MTIRVRDFALIIERYPVRLGWSLHKWKYRGQESWKHGSASVGRFKIMW